MKKATKCWLILATALILVGCILFGGVMTMLNWDFSKLSTASYSTNRHSVEEAFSHISLQTVTASIRFLPAEDGRTSVVCHEPDNQKHSVTLRGDTLVIERIDTRQWYEHIGLYFEPTQITVYLPQTEYGSISLQNTTGEVSLQNIRAAALDISSTTGDISLTDVVCTGDLSVQLTTGHIRLEDSDAATLALKTVTGSVSGTLLTGKTFTAKAVTGGIDIPDTTGGSCRITTTTGSITIRIRSGE